MTRKLIAKNVKGSKIPSSENTIKSIETVNVPVKYKENLLGIMRESLTPRELAIQENQKKAHAKKMSTPKALATQDSVRNVVAKNRLKK